MAIFEYRCEKHGSFDAIHPVGGAPQSAACQECGELAPRVYTAPMLRHPRQDLIATIDQAQKSSHEPEVISSLPATGKRQPQPRGRITPEMLQLPRP